jgi:hypothetical protein
MKYNDIVELIQDKSLYEYSKVLVDRYGSEENEVDAAEVTKWLLFLLKNDGLIAENSHQLFVDVLLVSAIAHNLTYKYGEEEFANLFKTRKLLGDLNEELGHIVQETYLESVYQAYEGQLGKDHPMVLLIPNPNTPGAHFALACSIYYKTENTIK